MGKTQGASLAKPGLGGEPGIAGAAESCAFMHPPAIPPASRDSPPGAFWKSIRCCGSIRTNPGWPRPGSNRGPSAFQADAHTD